MLFLWLISLIVSLASHAPFTELKSSVIQFLPVKCVASLVSISVLKRKHTHPLAHTPLMTSF